MKSLKVIQVRKLAISFSELTQNFHNSQTVKTQEILVFTLNDSQNDSKRKTKRLKDKHCALKTKQPKMLSVFFPCNCLAFPGKMTGNTQEYRQEQYAVYLCYGKKRVLAMAMYSTGK